MGKLSSNVESTNSGSLLAISFRWDLLLTSDIYIYRMIVFVFTPSPGSSYEYPDYNGEEYDYNDYKDYQEGESTQIPVIRIFIGITGTCTDTALVDCQ